MSEQWDKPSAALKRIAEQKNTPLMEKCPNCPHHAHQGEVCATYVGFDSSCTCGTKR